MQHELAGSTIGACQARDVANQLLSISDNLVCRGSNAEAAEASLEQLITIREKLDDQGTGLELADQRVDQLIALKDRSIAQTADVAAAIESLELMADVRDQLQRVAQTFSSVRQWVVEIVAFEPAINRAMRTLQPLTQLGNLRHMNPAELRQVLRDMNQRGETQWSERPAATPATVESPAMVPPISDAALAD